MSKITKIYDFDGTLFKTSRLHQRSFVLFAQKLSQMLGVNPDDLDPELIVKEAKVLFKGEADPVVFQKITRGELLNGGGELMHLIREYRNRNFFSEGSFISDLSQLRLNALNDAYTEGVEVEILPEFYNINTNEPLVIVTSNYEQVVRSILRDSLPVGCQEANIIVLGNETLLNFNSQDTDSIIPGKPNSYLLDLAVGELQRRGIGIDNLVYVGDSPVDIETVESYNLKEIGSRHKMDFYLADTIKQEDAEVIQPVA